MNHGVIGSSRKDVRRPVLVGGHVKAATDGGGQTFLSKHSLGRQS